MPGPEFHKALGVDIDWYDQEVFRKTSTIARQVFPIEIDIDHPRWQPEPAPDARGLPRDGRGEEAKAASAAGSRGWAAARRRRWPLSASTRSRSSATTIPENVRLEPTY